MAVWAALGFELIVRFVMGASHLKVSLIGPESVVLASGASGSLASWVAGQVERTYWKVVAEQAPDLVGSLHIAVAFESTDNS